MRYNAIVLFAFFALFLTTGCKRLAERIDRFQILHTKLGNERYLTGYSRESPEDCKFWVGRAWECVGEIDQYHGHDHGAFAMSIAAGALETAWRLDSSNYSIYWCWGVLWGIRGQYQTETDACIADLTMADKFFAKADELGANKEISFRLDRANLRNMLGYCYIGNGNAEMGSRLLQQTYNDLLTLSQNKDSHPRVWSLLAYNAFYRSDKAGVIRYVKKFREAGGDFPADFLETCKSLSVL